MSEEFKEFTSAPTLSFGEPLTAAPKPEMPTVTAESKPAPSMDDSMLSPEEKQVVESFVDKIDLHNAKGILEYGAGTQKKMADFSEATLNNVRSKDLGEIGASLFRGYRGKKL